jgi:hypothetical protein
MATREQLQTAVIQCGEQEKQMEIFQLSTLLLFPEDLKPRGSQMCYQAIQQLQQNAIVLDGLLEQVDDGNAVEVSLIPPTPILYNSLLSLDVNKLKTPIPLFTEAVITGDLVLVDLFLHDPRVDPSASNNLAIRLASEYGNLGVIERLLHDLPSWHPYRGSVDPSALNNEAIRRASMNGHLDVVNRLLQDLPSWHPYRGDSRPAVRRDVDPSAVINEAIRLASKNGHLCVVERLLQDPRVDPSADDNYAIRYASLSSGCRFSHYVA